MCVCFVIIFRYSCNRYDEKDAQAARDAQAVSIHVLLQRGSY